MEELRKYHERMARGYKIIQTIMSSKGKQNVGRALEVVGLLEKNPPKPLIRNGHIQHLAAIKAGLEMLAPPQDSKATLEPSDTIPPEEKEELVSGIKDWREKSRWNETSFTDKKQEIIRVVLQACAKGITHANEAAKPK